MSNLSALRRAVVITAASALAVSTVMVAGATSASAAVKPKTGGILTFLEHTPRLDHYDPSRIYTGRDLAFMNSFMTRTLVAYNPVPGAAGANLVPDLATNTTEDVLAKYYYTGLLANIAIVFEPPTNAGDLDIDLDEEDLFRGLFTKPNLRNSKKRG